MSSTAWDLRLRALTLFITSEGREPSPRASTPGERRLATWLQEQRNAVRIGRIAGSRLAALRDAALLSQGDADIRPSAAWLKVAAVADFIADEGRLPSSDAASSAGEGRLAAWLGAQLAHPPGSSDVADALRRIVADAASIGDAAVLTEPTWAAAG